MAEEKEMDVEKLLKNKLKDISTTRLEEEIASAVSKLIGEDYKCTVTEAKYSMFSGADFHIKLDLSLNE